MTTLDTARPITLGQELLDRFRDRAAGYDRDNRFFDDDFAELADLGYLRAAVPTRRGGNGLSLSELAALTRRLARHAPATALATSMHHYWVGLAADLEGAGIPDVGWILDEVVDGEVYAAGHAESGNDVPVLLSTCRAERVPGGYRFTGHKHFTSLSPRWTRLGVHGMDTADPAKPVIVHGFVDRAADGVRTIEVWDTLGMRATQSHDTALDGVFVPDERIGAVVPAGDPSPPFTGIMTVWALTLIANVYLGIAERAYELALAGARTKTAISLPRGTFAHHPFVQHQVSEMYLDLHAARATLDSVAADWSAGVDHGEEWGPLVLSAKWRAVESARRVVNTAMDVVGGSSFFRRSELERLYRDVRAGAYHPPTDAYAHEAIAKAALGITPDEPRW
jgi:alkylation response protein AidB-like acyl-CoA dehydrogenase